MKSITTITAALALVFLLCDPSIAFGQACNDGLDNDADGLFDYPNDPDCTSSSDTAELKPFLAASYTSISTSRGVYALGNYAYVADDAAGLRIIDVSSLSGTSLVSTYDTAGTSYDVHVRNGHAYVADLANGLVVVDVSSPASPTFAGAYNTPGYSFAVHTVGDYAYVADQNWGLQVVNVSDPSSPYFEGTYNTPGSSFGIYVEGSYAYIGDYGAGLQIIDVSVPTSPSYVGSYDTSGNAREVWKSGNYVYVADDGVGMQIIDVQDPANPSLLTTYSNAAVNWTVELTGPFAVLGVGSSGIQVVNVSDPANPVLAGAYNTPGTPTGISIVGNYAYISQWSTGLEIIDLNFTDSDGDGIPNWWENQYTGCGLDAFSGDSTEDPDGDYLTNLTEFLNSTDPCVLDDYDGDGMPDGWEIIYSYCGLDYLTGDSLSDPDGDGDPNLVEYGNSTDPCQPPGDTDGDGMPDTWEDLYACVDSQTGDSLEDPDGDYLNNIYEYNNSTNPCVLNDTDLDGMPDGYENTYGCLMANTADASVDHDSDGMTSLEEYNYSDQLDPCTDDTDGDGLSDGDEVLVYGTDPLDRDSDHDGLVDSSEIMEYGTDPLVPDSDGDGAVDGAEIGAGAGMPPRRGGALLRLCHFSGRGGVSAVMDIVTHAMAGAITGGTVSLRAGRPKVLMAVGALAGALPDLLDVWLYPLDVDLYYRYHRLLTHTVFTAPLVAGIAVLPFVFKEGRKKRFCPFLVALFSVFVHIGMDIFCDWPVRPFYPLIYDDFSLGIVCYSSPSLLVLLTLCSVLLLWKHLHVNSSITLS